MAKHGARHWLGVVVCVSVLVGVTSLPAVAQGADELAALNAQVVKLYQAGKYAEATEIAKRSLALAEKQLGPGHQVSRQLGQQTTEPSVVPAHTEHRRPPI